MRFLLIVPILAFVLAIFAHVEAAESMSRAHERELDPPVFAVEHVAVELPLFVEPQAQALVVDRATCGDVSELHEVQAATAVRLASQVPARRWYHHDRGCVAF